MFDLDDEYQLKLYNHLKNRTNGSSYIRTLLHQDLIGGEVRNNLITPPPDEIFKEQSIDNYEQPSTDDTVSDMKAATVKSVTHSSIRINVNNQPIDEDIFVEDLI
jgi:hypothetical protein